jgi:signal transduction histidine kinase
MSTYFVRCKPLDGLTWGALALVCAFCAIQALEWVLSPMSGIVGGSAGDLAYAWLSRLTVFLITGVTMLVTALVVLNAAGRAARDNFAVAAVAAVAGCVVAALTRYVVGATPATEGPAYMLLVFTSWLGSGAVLVAGYVYYMRAQAAQEEARAAELRRGALETQQLATRLRLLQAQVEPHFLFNTLSNVRRLYQSDAAAGRAMLAQLTRYLRAALPRMRENEATLADEIDLVSAYLGVQQVRMGARLEVAIDVPAALLEARIPSMMLATLVENAIKHGIAPQPEGGTIRVSAVRNGDCLMLTVADTGRGFAAASGTGVGLANSRARLSALYGSRAALKLEANSPRGVVAVITLPLP